MSTQTISVNIGNRPLTVEINKIARQADASALVRYGDTVVFVSATSKKDVKEPKPFLPLIVDYREYAYAAGKIPGGFFKREGRPSEKEILTSRLIDRPIRTLFPDGYYFDTQIIGLLLSADLENEPETLGLIGASVALNFSDIPFTTPIGAVKIGYGDGEYIINPTPSQQKKCILKMIVVGCEEGLVMLEAEGNEAGEDIILEAIARASDPITQIIEAQKELLSKLNIQKRTFTPMTVPAEKIKALQDKVESQVSDAFHQPDKLARDAAMSKVYDGILAGIPKENEDERNEIKEVFYQVQKKLARDLILNKKVRVDGRSFEDIRTITSEVGFLPRTHGSALFTRGETQALSTITLGTFQDVQRIDSIGEEPEKRFMLHYNFPPFSVGEVSFLRGAGRREIGHGALAEKSIRPSIPDNDDVFPYTIRIVSEIMESNGSSSMATVCSGVLALMDAGVPLKMIVAGIAIGLVKENDRYAVLTDIAGMEDFFGDMDLKIAGSRKGITAMQMDLKTPGISMDILKEGLEKAKKARLTVLDKMLEVIAEPRPDISPYAPRIENIFVSPDKIAEVIGPSGKIIKRIVAESGAKVDIDDTGKITIASSDMEAVKKAIRMISDITEEAEIGRIYEGKVIRIEEYGAFVEILPNAVGLLHISEYSHQRIPSIRDVVQMGQILKVKVVGIDDMGKVKVSRKALEPREEGAERSNDERPARRDNRNDRGDRSSPYKKRDPKDRF
ncbi:MAG: polyribonucleotide nucleotidyltransferase [Acidobacteria bacterium]|nr:polyribonucleotide nucleotidyltransferase [Acidobacteriota bacterium]MBU4330747.1 polyribonucleotide nucleotidyltransferase [Acidobacteriota bacterium]MBU4493805.1 polyribonucleotide nucleotidyltransferase [Acidobacteriota bacterium]